MNATSSNSIHLEYVQIPNYPVKGVQLEPGDRIVFCSDGIIEDGNSEEEMFGFEQTEETIKKECEEDLSAEQLLDYLLSEVKKFSGDTLRGTTIS